MTYAAAGLKTGDKIGKATVHVDFVAKGNTEIRPGKAMKPQYITIHNTGNPGRGANAKAHNTLMHNMAGKHPRDTSHISWHVAIDENAIYIHIPFNETAWHCGDGANGTGNTTSIGLEICMHSDQLNYMQAEENAIALAAHLVRYYGLSASRVQPHQRWSGKYCPSVILKRDGNLDKFRAYVGIEINTALKAEQLAKEKAEAEAKAKAEAEAAKKAAEEAAKKAQATKKKQLVLPKTASSWAVYPTTKAPVKKNAIGYLNPKKFGGLTYDILGNPQADVYTIKTANFGTVNIYAAKSTGAKIQ